MAMTEHSPEFIAFMQTWREAVNAGLTAAAAQYEPAVKARLARGYTSGDWVGEHHGVNATRKVGRGKLSMVQKLTIRVVDSVRTVGPRGKKVRWVRILSDVFYAALWEFGHHNRFSKKFERVEHWRHALQETYPQIVSAFHVAFNARIQAGGTSNAVTGRAA